MPYPRIHITNVRGHGIPPCPLCVFPPGGACSPHGMHGTHRSLGCVYCPQNTLRRVWHPCHTHAAHCQSSHRIHGIHRSFWRKMFSHRFHRFPQIFRSRKVLPQNSQNPQKRLVRNILPQISQMPTDG